MTQLISTGASLARYVFVPEMPTPNGRLHLGHMSGPYLRADILARFLRSRGGEAYIVSGSDVYESHVELKAEQSGQSIHEVCNRYHREIHAELDALDIECELYVHPLDPEIGSSYVAFNRRTLDDLRACGAAERATERVLYSDAKKRYVAGCWLSGECPVCGSKSGSYSCEACGTQYDPEDVRNVNVPTGFGPLREARVDTWFLKVRKRAELWAQIARMGIAPDFVRIVERYFEVKGHRVRLTNPASWGMPYESPEQVIFTYTALFSFSVYCGQLLAERRGWRENPFDPASTCTTIAGFGIDNAIPYLVGVLSSAIELGTYRPFDYYLTNHFYQLDGKKFSTSRRHLVSARDLVVEAGVDVDSLRYYLAKVNPENGKRSFSPSEFVRFHNDELVGMLNPTLAAALKIASAGAGDAMPEMLRRRFEELYRGQEIDLAFPRPCLERAVSTLDHWCLWGRTLEFTAKPADSASASAQARTAFWWLKGFALLAWPFMPRTARRTWEQLGQAGTPSATSFFQPARSSPLSEPFSPFSPANAQRIERSVSRES